ncbi:hypothetical protein OUZ56_011262 [Daphnia magna]|uniref:ZSWIM1/3 RNaseH-like domain-containing protein n=1 Tax=Daphnia magna TaxID=35525 RepID=A0ABQ9YZM5_9CRUS|nr:hypothetical protein OUZ56_011262 [Daphnia magna]
MSILDSLTKNKTFDSHRDIVTFIQQLEEDFVYLRRGDTKSLELVHQNHPVSEEHLQTYARKKHLAPEALDFAKSTLAAGAQPTKVRKLLLDKFGSHLISKDIINLKQTLTGKSDEEWKDVVEILSNLKNDENNVIKVLHDNEEVAAIFVQLGKQRRLYSKYGAVLQLDGTYNTNKIGFALYHLMIVDNNGVSQPVAMFFIREETTESFFRCTVPSKPLAVLKENKI